MDRPFGASALEKWADVVKEAAPSPSGIGRALQTAGIIAGATVGADALYNLGRKALNAARFSQDYKNMLDSSPDLREQDSKKVMERFRVLHTFGPNIAREPVVAAGFVKQTLEYPAITPAVLKDIVDVEGRSSGGSSFAPSPGKGQSAITGAFRGLAD